MSGIKMMGVAGYGVVRGMSLEDAQQLTHVESYPNQLGPISSQSHVIIKHKTGLKIYIPAAFGGIELTDFYRNLKRIVRSYAVGEQCCEWGIPVNADKSMLTFPIVAVTRSFLQVSEGWSIVSGAYLIKSGTIYERWFTYINIKSIGNVGPNCQLYANCVPFTTVGPVDEIVRVDMTRRKKNLTIHDRQSSYRGITATVYEINDVCEGGVHLFPASPNWR